MKIPIRLVEALPVINVAFYRFSLKNATQALIILLGAIVQISVGLLQLINSLIDFLRDLFAIVVNDP
jgi:hypothetical protein